MDDSKRFTVGMFLFPLLLAPAIILVLVLVGRAISRRAAQGGRSGDPVPPAARWGCGLSLLLAVCGFCGLMVATAGGAIHPPLVTAAAPYVCDGTVETQLRTYSYKPGQQGVARNIFCVDPDGSHRDITLRAIGAATVHYTLIFLPIGLLLGIAARRWARSRLSNMSARVGSPDMAELKSLMADRLRMNADIARRPSQSPKAGGGSVEDRLRHLRSLRDSGMIDEAEYRAKRAEILAAL